MKKNKKKMLAAAAVLLAVALGSGTFAWFTSDDDVQNHFEGALNGNDIKIVESFIPPKDIVPGTETNKDVAIANVSEYDTLIRVSLSETLKKLTAGGTEFYFDTNAAAVARTANPDDVTSGYYSWKKGDTGVYEVKTMDTVKDENNKDKLTANIYEIPVKDSKDPSEKAEDPNTQYKKVTGTITVKTTVIDKNDASKKDVVDETINNYKDKDGNEYAFTLYENKTNTETGGVVSEKYSYIGQWVQTNAKGGVTPKRLKAYLGSNAGTITRDASGNISFAEGYGPKVSMVDKTYDAAGTLKKDWRGTAATTINDGEYDIDFTTIGDNIVASALKDSSIQVNGKDLQPIEIKFNNQAISTGTPTPDKWFYNKDDGYFYYIGNVAPGGQTPQLIDSVKLKGDADSTYSLMQYDLNVHSEGIQSNEEAVSSWNPTSPANKTLPAALKAALETAAKVKK